MNNAQAQLLCIGSKDLDDNYEYQRAIITS